MPDDAKNTLTPKLRFPAFRKGGPWADAKIGDMLEETARPIAMDDDKTYSLVTVKRRYGGVVSREHLTGRAIKVKSQFIVKPDDFLISKRQIVHNACGLVPKQLDCCIVSNEYSVLCVRRNADIHFFNYFSQQPAVSASFLSSSVGIVIEKMLFKLETWLRFEFPFPSIEEQRKIADCLTSLDDCLAAQGRKVEALKAHKKGLMQQLFPREGETLPRLRFPEFRSEASWQAKSLAGVAAQGFTNGIFNDTKRDPSSYRLINVLEMYLPNPIFETDLVFARATEEEIVKKLVYYGDIFFTRSSLVREGMAFSNIFLGSGSQVTFDGHVIRLRPDVRIVDPLFLHYALKSNVVRAQLVSKSKTATMTTIGQDDVAETTLSVPTLSEQWRIAFCFSSLDARIAAEGEKLAALKTHKKGLMQQLFPSPEGAARGAGI